MTIGNTFQERMEDISIAYVKAVAAVNGYSIDRTERDNDGVDATISCKGKPSETSTLYSPKIDVQLKATSSSNKYRLNDHGDVVFALEVKNYKSLIEANRYNPLILIVLLMPSERDEWVLHSEECLKLQKCAYWISLKGKPETNNTSTINVTIPQGNILSPEALRDIMIRISKGEEAQL